MTRLGKEAGLKSFEQVKVPPKHLLTNVPPPATLQNVSAHRLPLQVKDIYVHPEQFSIENGLLTPTLKAKRNQLQVLFQPQLQQLYADMAAP